MTTPKRWQEIDRIFAAALEREPAARAAFLDEACAGDELLRKEVESLLAHDQPESLVGAAAVEEATRLLEKRAGELPTKRIGRYQIIRSLGAGGMGRVYLGLDEQLNRRVAVKLLSNYDASEAERMRRFRQEALAASALNHPNILTIYEIGEFEGANFITAEFVDGLTLRARMKAEALALDLALDIAIQIASALSAAHAAGIIHRDIKPENVMVRADGLVKVLDFGIAKFTQAEGNEKIDLVETMPGRIIGTAAYMSPEQARGGLIDARSDIWSLGVILYEMVGRRLPFWGNTPADVIAAVLERQPTPLPTHGSVALESFERIVFKALQKERENRYQTAAELLTDLKQLRQTLEHAGDKQQSESQQPSAASRTEMVAPPLEPQTVSALPARTSGDGGTTASSAEYFVDRIKHHKYAVLILLTLIAAAAFFAYRALLSNKSQPIESIAVMPFVNESGNSDVEYLSDGMTDSLINSLSQLPHLSVKARSSVFRYKGKEVDPQMVAAELSVQAILSGRVVQHGDDLTLYLSLVEARNGNQIWGEQYNRKLTDLVVLQQEISREVSEKLRLKLTGEEQRRVAKRYTDSSEAYELYLKGQYFSSNPGETNLKKSIEYFQQAIDKDPNYALAYAGIGRNYQTLGGFLGFVSPGEAAPQGKAAIMKALSIDETLDDAHSTLAQFTLTYDWNLPEAEREYKRTIELNPNNPSGHSGYGTYLEVLGRFDEAVAERERSRQLDPVSAFSTADVGYPLYYARRYERALEYFQKALELDPNLSWGHLWIGQVYVQEGRYDEAIAEINRAIALSGGNVRDIATLGHAYAVSGKRDEALKVLGELQGQARQKYVSPYFIALIYTGLGEKEQAFAWLEKAYEQRHPYLILIKVEPVFDSLRSDPRFAELMRKVGLPQ